MSDYKNSETELKGLRKRIFEIGYKGKLAHFASCFSALEIIYTLYMKDVLILDEKDAEWEKRDRFILSKGHAGLALYAVLNKKGLVSDEVLCSYLQEKSFIGGEPCMRDCEWIEATTGSLGHGLPMAVGMAMALKMNRSKAKVYVLLGDGECEEGTVWEAAMNASQFKLDNLIVILDNNGIQKMDLIEKTIGNPRWNEKWASFGFDVFEVDGHNVEQMHRVFKEQIKENEKPHLVIAHTVKGKGVSIMEGNPAWHFKMPNRKELKIVMTELDITEEELA